MLLQTSARPGLRISAVSGMGSAWGRPRPAAGSTVLIAARTVGRCCRGGVSAAGEGWHCSSFRVALQGKGKLKLGTPRGPGGEKFGASI